MKLTVPYLDRMLPLDIPDKNLLCIAEPNDIGNRGMEEGILKEALDLGGGPGLKQFLEGTNNVLVIINDATRPTPTLAMLKALWPFFKAAGLEPEAVTLLVATGAHRAPTEEEYRVMLGELYGLFRARCVAHDAKNSGDMVSVGVTGRGTPVALNRLVFEAERIVVTGSVEPHYFAGFTGGPKAFLPGVAAYETIKTNHEYALKSEAKSLVLAGNPVHDDMDDVVEFLPMPVFSFMTVLDKDQKTAAAFSGDIMTSFREAVEFSKKIFCVSVPEKADVVISVAKYPMDIDLYQSQKAIDNGALALKDGGTLILVSSCRDGLGDKTYATLLKSAASPDEALEKIRQEYKLGYHKAAKIAMVSARAEIKAVSELPVSDLAPMFIDKSPLLQTALEEALEKGKTNGVNSPKVLVLPDACVTVPLPGDCNH